MSEIPIANEPGVLTPELIQERTGFKLFAIFPDFAQSGRISPDLHDERERLASELGEDNVLTSMCIDYDGILQLGLFFKETPEETDKKRASDIPIYSFDDLARGIGRE